MSVDWHGWKNETKTNMDEGKIFAVTLRKDGHPGGFG
ncbi:MAG: hypothetical protein JWQ49_3461 [Edaphobacter sp.]|nr:hypothetical protein [Edaphobacter sp.]